MSTVPLHPAASADLPRQRPGLPAAPSTDALVARAQSAVDKAGVTADRVVAELAEHEQTGHRVVRLVDADTRQVVGQVPPEVVLDLIAWAMDVQRRKEDRDGQH
ncbi:flagellar protein FlaG [Quadrisphaera sp. GCM10027208]|uniref:flagellar protein FlaG n=1 Tax=Quadrisphaera sp. GCM10027208 TaxID=3273423 RepID=UPI003612BD95|nr:hypothetical protein HJG43_02065 [Kineosporiaceae bacterium SCSIO 59966]